MRELTGDQKLAAALKEAWRSGETDEIVRAENDIFARLDVPLDETERGPTEYANRQVEAFYDKHKARLTYDEEEGGLVCSHHGATMVGVSDVEPTESGSWYYACRVCGVSGWSGI